MDDQTKRDPALRRLISVKSITTLSMTATLIALMFVESPAPEEFKTLFSISYTAMMTYFFKKPDNPGSSL